MKKIRDEFELKQEGGKKTDRGREGEERKRKTETVVLGVFINIIGV